MMDDVLGFLASAMLAGLFVFWLVSDVHDVDRAIIAWQASTVAPP